MVGDIAFEWLHGALSWALGRVFGTAPRIFKENGILVATTGWKSHVLSLGFGSRELEVDPRAKTLTLAVRRFWAFTSRRVLRFAQVKEVVYAYCDLSTGFGAHQEQDLFVVGLLLQSGERVNLFRFFGAGAFSNETIYPDWMYWPSEVAANLTQGNQESASLAFADLLSRMIGVPIGNGENHGMP